MIVRTTNDHPELSPSESEYSQSCPGSYSYETLVGDPTRKVLLETFKGCEDFKDQERVRVVLSGAQDEFMWIDTAFRSWRDEAERRGAIESAQRLRLVEFGANGEPIAPAD